MTKGEKLSEKGSSCRSSTSASYKSRQTVEFLKEGQECPLCHFANLKREGAEIVCPVCGYGYRAST